MAVHDWCPWCESGRHDLCRADFWFCTCSHPICCPPSEEITMTEPDGLPEDDDLATEPEDDDPDGLE